MTGSRKLAANVSVPSIPTRASGADTQAAPTAHLVTFYDSDAELAATVGRYLREAIRGDAATIVIASEEHRRAFAGELPGPASAAWPTEPGSAPPEWLDAQETLDRFVSGDGVDGEAFHRVIGPVVRRAAASGRPVRAYGEMVALLWEAGNVPAAVELERLWNDLAAETTFTLLCAYPSVQVSDPRHDRSREEVCGLHTGVLGPAGAQVDPETLPAVCTHLPAATDAPRAARHLVSEALRRRGGAPVGVQNAELVVTELATNAVVHAGSPFWITARADQDTVRITVQDRSQGEPRMRPKPVTARATSGRGLRLVHVLSERWGVDRVAGGKAVWADLALAG